MDYYENVDINQTVKMIHGTKKGLFFGFDAIKKIADIFDDMKPSCIGFITSPGAYKKCGVWETIMEAVAARKIPYIHYDKIMTNPTTTVVDEAVAMFKPKYDEHFLVISIGGGSPGDAAKSVAALLAHQEYNCRQLYKFEFAPTKRANLVMINVTHGTGTECDSFAVVSILEGETHPYKPAIGYPCLYPDYSIDDINAMFSMSADMVRFTSIDALNHVMEAATTTVATPYSRTLCREVVYLVHRYLPVAMKDLKDRRARYWLTYASAIAGMSFDESLLHLTHALEHTLSAYVTNLTHGQGLALIQPAVLKHIYPASETIIQPLFEPILGNKKLTPQEAFNKMRQFHNSVGFTGTMKDVGFTKAQVQTLVEATVACPGMKGLIALSPVPCEEKDIHKIFSEAFFE
ncbi:Alcohol_dehydrogenase [Hexamita inflata]|uniref:Alcohol dehydrogenase n=1 Tax=Hexamita inflata TaxID=28002 RepID=A0AA86U7M5_9EUKA|nr:Alcohol dehydrogenase [Hexamita inflata]CAI9944334.1 Alcohol dehydrogenase [Hexamita inflata]CAI9963655.1 Alcohol dehydrogenase [Hexamita inflata]